MYVDSVYYVYRYVQRARQDGLDVMSRCAQVRLERLMFIHRWRSFGQRIALNLSMAIDGYRSETKQGDEQGKWARARICLVERGVASRRHVKGANQVWLR